MHSTSIRIVTVFSLWAFLTGFVFGDIPVVPDDPPQCTCNCYYVANNTHLSSAEFLHLVEVVQKTVQACAHERSQQPVCPSAFDVKKGNSCYYFSDFEVNWFAASSFCASLHEGSTLVTIQSEAENSFLVNQIKNVLEVRNRHYWTGLTDLASSRVWTWSKTGQLALYSSWHPGQPQNTEQGVEDCSALWYSSDYKWHDTTCYRNNARFICELELEQ